MDKSRCSARSIKVDLQCPETLPELLDLAYSHYRAAAAVQGRTVSSRAFISTENLHRVTVKYLRHERTVYDNTLVRKGRFDADHSIVYNQEGSTVLLSVDPDHPSWMRVSGVRMPNGKRANNGVFQAWKHDGDEDISPLEAAEYLPSDEVSLWWEDATQLSDEERPASMDYDEWHLDLGKVRARKALAGMTGKPRVLAGVPAGGQFAATSHADSPVQLGATEHDLERQVVNTVYTAGRGFGRNRYGNPERIQEAYDASAVYLAALGPPRSTAELEATRKHSDTIAWVRKVGWASNIDALAIIGSTDTLTPSSVNDLDVPIGWIDGRKAVRSAL